MDGCVHPWRSSQLWSWTLANLFPCRSDCNDGPECMFAKGEGFSQRGLSRHGGSSPMSLPERLLWHWSPPGDFAQDVIY